MVGATPPSIIVGALGPKMLAAAGEIADGTVTWMAGPRGLSEHIVPLLSKAAADAGRPTPRVVVGVPVAVCDSVDEGRAAVEETFARYNTLQNYRQQFEREGADSVGDLAVFGPADVVRSRFAAIRDAGATELWAVPFAVGADREASLARTSALLTELAPEFDSPEVSHWPTDVTRLVLDLLTGRMSGFRHVVMFRWAEDAAPEQREAVITALREMAVELAGLGTITVGTDAGLVEGNADWVVVADFPSQENYLAYQQDEGHQRIISELIRPAIASRTALQHHR